MVMRLMQSLKYSFFVFCVRLVQVLCGARRWEEEDFSASVNQGEMVVVTLSGLC